MVRSVRRIMNNNEEPEPDLPFGRYLATITERDIDLLFHEEFHICDLFVACSMCLQRCLRAPTK